MYVFEYSSYIILWYTLSMVFS